MKLWNLIEMKPRKLIAGELQMPKVVHDGVDTSKTTVTADVMLSPYTAIDANGELVTGTIVTREFSGREILSVERNGGKVECKATIKKGYYPSTRTTQALVKISTLSGITHTPTTNQFTIRCADHLMTGDIVIEPIPSDYVKMPDGVSDTDTVVFTKKNGAWVGEVVND